MAILVFFLLVLIAAVFIVYPLLPGRTPSAPATVVTDGDIEQAVRQLRSRRGRGAGPSCPSCGQGYQPGDQFCVRCGAGLPQAGPAQTAAVCPSCGAAIREGDQFCAKCGQTLVVEEAN